LKSGRTSGTPPAASPANEPLFDVGQAKVVGPWVAADRDRVRALIVGVKDKQPAHAHIAHFGKGDFLGSSCDPKPTGAQ